MGSKLTKWQLSQITDYVGFEDFCHDMMIRLGYQNIQPLGKSKDKGRDAIHTDTSNGITTIFAYSVREDWDIKLQEDLKTIQRHGHACSSIIFVTTQDVSAGEVDKAVETTKHKFGWDLEIYNRDRVATIVDNNPTLKQLHPNLFIDPIQSGMAENPTTHRLDTKAYATKMLTAYKVWQERYTTLLAEYRDTDIFAVSSSGRKTKQIPVHKLPELEAVVTIVGESGAGKTTALWKLVVDSSNNLLADVQTRIPVMISLRNWSPQYTVMELIKAQFGDISREWAPIEEELISGNFLILIDGLNELQRSYEQRDMARRDIQNFIDNYPKNRFVITCRTPDYDSSLFEVGPERTSPPIFEIQRLGRNQVIDYVERYFQASPDSAKDLARKLRLNDMGEWKNRASLVQFARVPLHLHMIILEYQRSGEIPTDKSRMLANFIAYMFDRDKVRQASRIGNDLKIRLLGELAYRGVINGYYLSLPETLLRSELASVYQDLEREGLGTSNLDIPEVLEEIFSNNFLVVTGTEGLEKPSLVTHLNRVEWLHQLIFDFFLATELNRLVVIDKDKDLDNLWLSMERSTEIWDQPCQIALGLLTLENAAVLLEKMFEFNSDLAVRACEEHRDQEYIENLIHTTTKRLANFHDPRIALIGKIVLLFPLRTVVEVLRDLYKRGSDEERIQIAAVLSYLIQKHYGTSAAKRAEELCEAWVANRNEFIRYYAATGLWARDPGRASGVLRKLALEGSEDVRLLVNELRGKWNIN